ncbi:unnamed protein product [Bursaphelenchus okinawaensis]|uniref:Uncharacterized protein n=1 Tax=Bursaphelenchus okinawaensis TaxID=465554 RepID=A0A811JRI2_9BILA|nr:unnamed protein product [Bursaphelenchus okinawaensis]CAG9080236.1 unnamed protein product [Bursaphelenchus okinawaensis]
MIITGATSGIGKGAALEMAKRKWSLVLTGRNAEAMKEIAEECKKLGAEKVTYTLGDLTDPSVAKKIVDHALKEFGKIDCLVNNAGMLVTGNLEEAKDDLTDFDAQMEGNVKTVVRLTKVALPHIIKSKGTIVNVSSVCGTNSTPAAFYYCMSKSALDQFTKCLAMELAGKGVRVNSVNPGVIYSEIQRRSGQSEDTYQKYLERSKLTHPMGRVGYPEETAKAIAFLASDDSSFTTGELLKVDGGRAIYTFD